MQVSPETIDRAAETIAGSVVDTPCLHSRTLSTICGCEVYLKFENLQFTASFKERGALVKLLSLSAAERARGVVAMSAGNHAQAVAHHATQLGISATVVMPKRTPNVKVEQTRVIGARVLLEGDELAEASAVAHRLAREEGLTFVHPYDDPDIVRGQGTVALEMLAAEPELDALVIPVGGGGLAAGCAVAAHARSPDLEIYGVQSARYPSTAQALAGEPISCGPATIADGIAVEEPGSLTLPLLREHLAGVVRVEESELEGAVLLYLEVEKSVVEGAGAASLAAVRTRPKLFHGRRVGLVVSGGNIDLPVLSQIIQRGLVRSRRLVRLRIELEDRPGALAEVTREIGEAGGNVVAVQHQRAFTRAALRSAEVDFVLETRGPDHAGLLLEQLRGLGYTARELDAAGEA